MLIGLLFEVFLATYVIFFFLLGRWVGGCSWARDSSGAPSDEPGDGCAHRRSHPDGVWVRGSGLRLHLVLRLHEVHGS